ncbi:MAG: NAD(P)-dependent alcohol dehydrogenase [Verrucomicrobiales bacterium]
MADTRFSQAAGAGVHPSAGSKPSPSGRESMAAVVCHRYGVPEVLQFGELERPIPKAGEILVRVRAASVTAADVMMREGSPFFGRLFIGLTKPKEPIPGTGFAGVVEAIGAGVGSFKVGDRVFGESTLGPGTSAEYVCVSEGGVLAVMPDDLSYEAAAPVCDGALTSLSFLKDVAKLRSGQKILINGASGSLGTAAVQLAKHMGGIVTGVCSTSNIELVKSLGADHVIDYTKSDFTKGGELYDVIYDTVGKRSFSACKGSLGEHGVFVSPVLGVPLLLQMLWTWKIGTRSAKFSATGLRPAEELRPLLLELVELLQAGKLKSVIDRRYGLEEIVDAHHYVQGGHKKGNVVIVPPGAAEGPSRILE